MSREIESGNYTVRGPVEMGAGLHEGRRRTEDDYEAAADYHEKHTPTAGDLRSIEIDPGVEGDNHGPLH